MYSIVPFKPLKKTSLTIHERSEPYIIAIVDKGYYLKYLITIINRAFPHEKHVRITKWA